MRSFGHALQQVGGGLHETGCCVPGYPKSSYGHASQLVSVFMRQNAV